MNIPVHRVVMLVVDTDRLGAEAVRTELENARYPNDCLSPRVLTVETETVEWFDGHPLNHAHTTPAAVASLFPSATAEDFRSRALVASELRLDQIADLREALRILHHTIGDLRRGFAASVDPARWVEQAQAFIQDTLDKTKG